MESINIATLKAQLSKYLRLVRRGKTIVVRDRHLPIARIVPLESEDDILKSRKAEESLESFVVPNTPACSKRSLDVLLEERQSHR